MMDFLAIAFVIGIVAVPVVVIGVLAYFIYLVVTEKEDYDAEAFDYDGERKGNLKHGEGTATYFDGSTYVGGYKKNYRHGQGTYTDADGFTLVGKWKKETLWDGTEYDKDGNAIATYSKGFKNGEGKIKHGLPTYDGELKRGKLHGQGTLTYSDGTKYVGEFRKGKQHGHGTKTISDGSTFVGQFKNGWRDHGTTTFTDGATFVGEWKEGDRHKGTLTHADGEKWVGQWNVDEFWNGTKYDKDGNVTAVYSEGLKKEN